MEQKQTNLGHKMSWFFSAMCCKIICQIVVILLRRSSEIRGLCLMKCPGKTFIILPYFWFSFRATNLVLCLNNECPGLYHQRPGHSLLFHKKNDMNIAKNNVWVFILQKCGKV